MTFTTVEDDYKDRGFINQWAGYNANTIANAGEFRDMENMEIRDFPVLESRAREKCMYMPSHNTNVIYVNDKICYAYATDSSIVLVIGEDGYIVPSMNPTVEYKLLSQGTKILLLNNNESFSFDIVTKQFENLNYEFSDSFDGIDLPFCNSDGTIIKYTTNKDYFIGFDKYVLGSSGFYSYKNGELYEMPMVVKIDNNGFPIFCGSTFLPYNAINNENVATFKISSTSSMMVTTKITDPDSMNYVVSCGMRSQGKQYYYVLLISDKESAASLKRNDEGRTYSGVTTIGDKDYYYEYTQPIQAEISALKCGLLESQYSPSMAIGRFITKLQYMILSSEEKQEEIGFYKDDIEIVPADSKGNKIVDDTKKPDLHSPILYLDSQEIESVFLSNPLDAAGYLIDDTKELKQLYSISSSSGIMVEIVPFLKLKVNKTVNGASLKEGDAINIKINNNPSGIQIPISLQNEIYRIDKLVTENEEDYIIVQALVKGPINYDSMTYNSVNIERKIPAMDFWTIAQNRLWGCRFDLQSAVNSIYASKQGDFANFYYNQGALEDSWTQILPDCERFTGVCTYKDMPFLFKENRINYIYGNNPSNYSTGVIDDRGCEEGSDNSIVVLNNYVFYKSPTDICMTDGTTVQRISDALGDTNYFNAKAGATDGKYFVSMDRNDGKAETFVFYLNYGIWHKLNEVKYNQFIYNNGGMCLAICGDKAYNLGLSEQGDQEITLDFKAETCQLGYESPDKKYVNRFVMRALIDKGAKLTVSMQYDDEEWQVIGTFSGIGKVKTYIMDNIPQRCDIYSLKFEGRGKVKIISLASENEGGSDY